MTQPSLFDATKWESRSPDGDGRPMVKGLEDSACSSQREMVNKVVAGTSGVRGQALAPTCGSRSGDDTKTPSSLKPAAGSEPADSLQLRDRALTQVSQHAEDHRPGFLDEARAFVLGYLQQHGATSGEVLTLACKAAGIVPHDDRAFGSVYLVLANRGAIRKVGTAKRLRGHNTCGGNIWEAR